MQKIYYLAHYDLQEKENRRNVSPAAISKINYVSKAISDLGYEVKIISPATANKPGTYKKSKELIANGIELNLFTFKYSKFKVFRLIYRFIFNIKIFLYFIFKVKKKSKIIVYHSLSTMRIVKWLKKLKKYKIIYEVNEIYGDVSEKKRISNKEKKSIIKVASAFIFPTKLLNELINIKNKTYAINHGDYRLKKEYSLKFDDDRIHCVYSGTFASSKGVINAIKAAVYLNSKYHIHIIGFGTKKEIESVKELIHSVQSQTKCIVTYDGLYFDEDYDRFLQKCDIGLSTQPVDNKYNNTSFPSKILSYLGNNLNIVSVKLDVLDTDYFNEYITYYDIDDPKEIARAIKSINLKNNKKNILKKLDGKFKNEFLDIIKEIEESK